MITAKVICDSISPDNVRLTTLQLHFPRIILAEINTHGALAKNARSTRAVPTSKLIKEVRENPYVPAKWGMNNPGMQSNAEIVDAEHIAELEKEWREAARDAADHAEKLFNKKLHKQWAGRVLEPYMWVDSVVSATDWANFFALRYHPDAQPEFEDLAKAIRKARDESTPEIVKPGQWHLPYIQKSDADLVYEYFEQKKSQFLSTGEFIDIGNFADIYQKLSVARCARVSYAPFDGDGSIEKELQRYDLLVNSKPVHSSCLEHQATPDVFTDILEGVHKEEWGRFYGWRQYRKMIPGNTVLDR